MLHLTASGSAVMTQSLPTSGCQHQAEGTLIKRKDTCLDGAYLGNASVGQLHFPLAATRFPVTYKALTLCQTVF